MGSGVGPESAVLAASTRLLGSDHVVFSALHGEGSSSSEGWGQPQE